MRIHHPDYDSDHAGLRSASRGGCLHEVIARLVLFCVFTLTIENMSMTVFF